MERGVRPPEGERPEACGGGVGEAAAPATGQKPSPPGSRGSGSTRSTYEGTRSSQGFLVLHSSSSVVVSIELPHFR
jgi:hypothetical protein